jgi:hypothetical protein
MMEERKYDRAVENVGNIVNLGHVNTGIVDQGLSTVFYVLGLGLTRDPVINVGVNNMWINIGQSQFHLPTGKAEVLRGTTGLVVPDREALLDRLAKVRKPLEGTQFDFRERNDGIETVCPWGNRITCHSPDEGRFGPVSLNMGYIEFDVRPGTAEGIARFYREIIGAAADVVAEHDCKRARVAVGMGQEFLFRETDAPEQPFDGHHIQIYVADFFGPYQRLLDRGLIFQESNQHQYRFKDIIDLDAKTVLFTIDHEVRSMRHPFYGRELYNRNPTQTNQHYRPGRDRLAPSIE